MNKKILVIITFLLSLNVFASTKNKSSDFIPFVTYQTHVIYDSVPGLDPKKRSQGISSGMNKPSGSRTIAFVEQKALQDNVPIVEVQELITKIRRAVCGNVGDANVKVWISFDASGKLLGVGASSEAGLEITFHCIDSYKK